MGSGEMVRNVGLVGAGAWGKNLARNFFSLGALHSICDANESILDRLEADYPDVNMTSNFKTLLEHPEVTRVVIAAPAIMHYALAKQALQAGKDVYVEKPLCLNSDEGEELIQLAERQGAILMVGHLLHYHPCVNKLQELLSKGELGQLQYIVSNRLNLGRFRTEENALWNFAPHDISLILSLCGERLPQEVRCVGAAYLSEGVADTSLTTLSFQGGTKAHIYVSWLNPFKEQKLTVIGSKGMAVFDDTQSWENKLILYRDHVTWCDANIPHATKPNPERVIVPKVEPLREECRHFLESCEHRTRPRTDGQEGLQVLKVLQAAQASLNENGEAKDPSVRHSISLLGSTPYFAHDSAVVEAGAEIGEGTKIWHFSHIMAGAKLGRRCNIGQNVVISPGVVLGDNTKVQNNVSVYSGVICEQDVFLGPSMVFTNIRNPRSEVVRKNQYQTTRVRKGATLGANSTILCGLELGAYAFVGAGAVVTRNVRPYALVMGNPAVQVGWMSRMGHRLELPLRLPEGEVMETRCPESGELYRLTGERLEAVENLSPVPSEMAAAAHS